MSVVGPTTDLATKRIQVFTVTNISRSFTYKMAAKINWRIYGTKLRHCHPMCSKLQLNKPTSFRFSETNYFPQYR